MPSVLRLQLLNILSTDLAAALTLSLNDVPTQFTISSDALVTAHGPSSSHGQNPDQRWLGVCLQSVELDLV